MQYCDVTPRRQQRKHARGGCRDSSTTAANHKGKKASTQLECSDSTGSTACTVDEGASRPYGGPQAEVDGPRLAVTTATRFCQNTPLDSWII